MDVYDDDDDDDEEDIYRTSEILNSPLHELEDATEEAEKEDITKSCLALFATTDYILEHDIFQEIKKYLNGDGPIEDMVKLLCDNYVGVAQMVNLLAEWLIQSGIDISEVQKIVEQHLQDMIYKHFDPKKADSIFTDSGETPAWLIQMIDVQTWRSLFYRLAEEYPDCLMLNFVIKLISDAGHQREITSVSTACHQLEVFSRVLRTLIAAFLDSSAEDPTLEKLLPEFNKMVCHGEHTYLFSQLIMDILRQEVKGGHNVYRLAQEVQKSAKERWLDVTPITMAFSGAAAYPKANQALSSMLSKNELNPADVTILYKLYTSPDPPPVQLLRCPQFLDLFIDSLFKPGTKINPEHKSKYIFLLSFASCVIESNKKAGRKSLNKDELKATITALEKVQILTMENKSHNELLADVASLFQCIKFPIVAVGVLHWMFLTISEPTYFQLNFEHAPFYFVLIDEIASIHSTMLKFIFEMVIKLFESPFEGLDDLVLLNLRKMIIDRMVHLLSCSCVLPVVQYINMRWKNADTDVSLIRHFVIEVLDVISPPYTSEFVQAIFPLMSSSEITASLGPNETEQIKEFIKQCQTSYNV